MFTQKKFTATIISVSFSAIVALTSSSSFAGAGHSGDHGNKTSIGEAGKASEVDQVIEIEMYDNYYEPEKLNIKEGQTVRFVVKNLGEFVHEFNIGTAKMHAAHQEEMEMMMEHGMLEPDKINHDMMKMDMGNGSMEHNDPNSILLEPGKDGEIIWRFSEDANLEFACNVPGHYDSGMMGTIHFESGHGHES